jgi:ribosomal protein L18E
MLRWKVIMDRWHLTHEDISICRLVQQVAVQTDSEICLACLDAIADERLQWQNLNLSKLKKMSDGQF